MMNAARRSGPWIPCPGGPRRRDHRGAQPGAADLAGREGPLAADPQDHPRIRHAFIPTGACWLNMQDGWRRIFRRQALAGQSFADPDEIAHATKVATAQLNAHAQPWIRGRPQPKTEVLPPTLHIHPLRNISTSHRLHRRG